MLRTVEATIEADGTVKLDEQITLPHSSRALVTILEPIEAANEAFILSESSLVEGWSGADEDKAWEHLKDLPDIKDA